MQTRHLSLVAQAVSNLIYFYLLEDAVSTL
jgi:hypothetical protein